MGALQFSICRDGNTHFQNFATTTKYIFKSFHDEGILAQLNYLNATLCHAEKGTCKKILVDRSLSIAVYYYVSYYILLGRMLSLCYITIPISYYVSYIFHPLVLLVFFQKYPNFIKKYVEILT